MAMARATAFDFGAPRRVLRGLALPVGALAAWWAFYHFDLATTLAFPPPAKTLQTLVELAKSGELAYNLKQSLIRVGEGFLSGAIPGLAVGMLLGLSAWARRLLSPSLNAFRQVPVVGWLPLMIVWFGIGEVSKVAFIAIGAFFPVVLSTSRGILAVPKEYVELGQVYGYGPLQQLLRVVLPAALPSILTGLRFSLSLSWMLVVASELMMLSAGGIGSMMAQGRELFQMDVVIVGMLVIGLAGFATNYSIRWLEQIASRGRA